VSRFAGRPNVGDHATASVDNPEDGDEQARHGYQGAEHRDRNQPFPRLKAPHDSVSVVVPAFKI